MKVRFLEVAQQELDEAVGYYNAESSGLGAVFLSEAVTAIARVRRHPSAWAMIGGSRCRTRRFPYGLIYHADRDEIVIVAVANLHRQPIYWRHRIVR